MIEITTEAIRHLLEMEWINKARVAEFIWHAEIEDGYLDPVAARSRLNMRLKRGTPFSHQERKRVAELVTRLIVLVNK